MSNPAQHLIAAGGLNHLRKWLVRDVACIAIACVASALMAAPAMAEFGLHKVAVSVRNQNGTPDVQAGSHPYALTSTFVLTQPPGLGTSGDKTDVPPEGDLRDLRAELPPGFVGNPNATPTCTYQEFIRGDTPRQESGCSDETAVGMASTYVTQAGLAEFTPTSDSVYNLEPPPGVAAEFGFIVAGVTPVLLETSVRTGGDYGLTSIAPDISQAVIVAASKVTIWGVPADPAHNLLRGKCLDKVLKVAEPVEAVNTGLRAGEDELEGPIGTHESGSIAEPTEASEATGGCATQAPVVPLLTNPTSCNTPRTATLSADSWEEPGNFSGERTKSVSLPELVGCEKLNFSPTIGVTPDGRAGSTPTGLNVELHVPQETTANPVGLAEADVKDTTVALPAGLQLSPSAADGLQACSNAQIGYTGLAELDPSAEPGVQTPQFTPAAPSCPNASKVANVRIRTPLLEGELEGSVYLAAPQNFTGLPENPFSSLIALYLVAEEPKAGVLIKLAGKVSPNPITGQLVSTFENTPQLPFSDLKLEFFGTDRAPLATPALCGTYKTEASFVPWSATPAVNPSTAFQITSGPNSGSCSDPLPFSPTLQSGTTNNNAGAFSDLTTTLSRDDGQQSVQSVTLHYPPGLSGLLPGVKLCGEAAANSGTCGSESQIGETVVSVGLGNDPFSVMGGRVYITGPYNGSGPCAPGSPGCAPFGLSIVNPAKAGPFDLQEGRPVVVRAKIEVDPNTAALTIATNAPGTPYAIPTIIEGIPLQIKHVNVNVTRPGFTFNPTDCNPMDVTGTIDSAEGAASSVSVPFQVTNCAALKFAPKFTASTSARTSRTHGASLAVKLSYPSAPFGSQANIARVKVELPKQLPSPLKTLQKACAAAQFRSNPAGCPAASLVGHAKAITPLVPVPLAGPAYFVSNGNEAFPNLIVVLQGYGVTIDLVGDTFIKHGVTSSTFKTVPDAPVGSFELTLPEGPYPALTANGNLCKAKSLAMPTEFVAQNGAQIHQSTRIAVIGCPKAKAVRHRKKAQGHAKTGRRGKGS